MANVKVAVRVRPFNQREIGMDSRLIIEMEGKKTRIFNPKGGMTQNRFKEFYYDYSYWSVDSNDSHYATQEQVFEDLGTKVVESAFDGYNACTFAYGQTGSGKTHTMMGTEEEAGLIPRICRMMFSKMQQNKEEGITFRTEVSYLEIYNEKVKDLLKKDTHQHNLRLREHPKLGPYVQDLSKHLVMDYRDIEELMNQGNSIRTTAVTKMNDASSRSHAIFTLTFVQAKFDRDMPIETASKIHLVDLAGSERADATGATGDRLKEGGHINKSLVTLGSVISALSDMSTSAQRTKPVFIPYRDSILTWLLRDSLGGNAKTIMIATISPADCNFGETLGTLRYASRAKNIINKPRVNEDPNVKLIRELKAEISKLRNLLDSSQNAGSSTMVEKLHQNEARVKVLTEEWTERWRETQKILQEQKALGLRKSGIGVVLDSDRPHLIGIDDDLLSTGITLYHLKEGSTSIGSRADDEEKQDIVLMGVGIEEEHCIITLRGGTATLVPVGHSVCFIDGLPVDRQTKLSQGCVILLGRTSMFRYNDPAEAAKLRKEKKGLETNRQRMSFMSWSMPDLANSIDNGPGMSPCSRIVSPSDSSTQFGRRNVEVRLLEAKGTLDRERKVLRDRWEALFGREKLLLEAIDKASYNSEEERHFLDFEQEEIEAEQRHLETAEEQLDDRERHLQEVYQRIVGEERAADEGCTRLPTTLVEEDVEVVGEPLPQTYEDQETTSNEGALTSSSVDGDNMSAREVGRSTMQLDIENSLRLQGIPVDDRVRELVQQEVQRHLLKEMATRLEDLRSLKEHDASMNGSRPDVFHGHSASRFPRAGRSVSLGHLAPATEPPREPFSITIPSFILRGAGSDTHFEYEIKVVVRDESWTMFRRYRRFRELHLRMKQKYGAQVRNIYFPPRVLFRSRSEKLVRERQVNLETQCLCNRCYQLVLGLHGETFHDLEQSMPWCFNLKLFGDDSVFSADSSKLMSPCKPSISEERPQQLLAEKENVVHMGSCHRLQELFASLNQRYLQQLIDLCLRLPSCPLSAHTYETLTKQVLCDHLPFLRKGIFEVGKHSTT